MVFYPPHLDSYYIKRVIGLPGDRVSYDNRELFINGERVALEALGAGEEGLQRFVETLGVVKHEIQYEPGRLRRPQEWRVPADAFLVFGDNRDRSADSRSWGYVPEANVIGQAVAIWMHKAPGLALPRFHRNGAIE
jgi:signal peptidase I